MKDPKTYFLRCHAAKILAPYVFRAYTSSTTNMILSFSLREITGEETMPVRTPQCGALQVALEADWVWIWDGTTKLKKGEAEKHLIREPQCGVQFKRKCVEDLATLVYLYEDPNLPLDS